jgi:hypothetical protein
MTRALAACTRSLEESDHKPALCQNAGRSIASVESTRWLIAAVTRGSAHRRITCCTQRDFGDHIGTDHAKRPGKARYDITRVLRGHIVD